MGETKPRRVAESLASFNEDTPVSGFGVEGIIGTVPGLGMPIGVPKDTEKIQKIPLSLLKQAPLETVIYNLNEDSAKIQALASDIANRGIQNALRVVPCGNGEYEIVSGHQRWLAAKVAKKNFGYDEKGGLPCVVTERPKEVEVKESLILNNLQRDKSDFERMMEIVEFKKCIEQRRADGEDIPNIRERVKDCLGVTDSDITRFEKIYTSLHEALMPAFRDGAIASTVAYDIAKMDTECQAYISNVWNREEEPCLTIGIAQCAAAQFHTTKNASTNETTEPEPVKKQKPVVVAPKTIDEGVGMLNKAFDNIRSSLSGNIKMDNRTKKALLKKITKHMAQLMALQNDLAALGLIPDESEE